MAERLGNLLRSLKGKKAPEMITHSEYSKEALASDQPAGTLNDELMEGLYNVFGVPLEKAAGINELFENSSCYTPQSNNSWEAKLCSPEYLQYVPKIILKCVRFINDYGLREEGLYRVSGSGQEVRELRNAFAQYGPSYDIPPVSDVHSITSLVKMFVRELPEELLPVKRHTFLAYTKAELPTQLSFTQDGAANFSVFTAEEEDMNPIVIPTQILQEILQGLTPFQFALVQTLTRHFAAVAQNSQYNRMTLTSLSLILCPTLKIHKSVFHALILKPQVWANLHPKQSEISARSIKYDRRNIVSYHEDLDSNAESLIGTAPSSSNTSVADVPFKPANTSDLPLLDPISLDIFNSTLDKNDHRSSIMFRPDDEHADEYFDNGVISFSSPLDLTKLNPDTIFTPASSLSSFSDSSSHNSRHSDTELLEIAKLSIPIITAKHEYRYKQAEGSTPKFQPSRLYNSTSNPNNRTLFLCKTPPERKV